MAKKKRDDGGDDAAAAKALRVAKTSREERAVVRRGADEVDFLASRAEATPMAANVAKAELRALRGRIESLVRQEGREMHEIGTALNTLYMRHADAALGYDSFRRFLLDEFADDPRRAYEAMAIARAATANLAMEKGARWVLRAAVWARLEGHADLSRALGLTVEAGDGSRVALRDASIRQIDEAIGRRGWKALDEPAGRKVKRARERVGELIASDPAVAALTPTVFLDRGEVVVRTVARSPDDGRALKRLWAAVWSAKG